MPDLLDAPTAATAAPLNDAQPATQRVGLDPRDYISFEAGALAVAAAVLFVVGILIDASGLLVLAGVTAVAATGCSLLQGARSLSAPTGTR
ncbi:MAG: hypothetical protein IPK37_05615 [Austwickia sp.]|jgi:UPF0716 family protein affecting phage T7 exclusion|nr:MAG: hypothetical protein IPK37_05615 [Austwickia sp.]